MSEMIKVLFYARKSKSNSLGQAPIYLRVTVKGSRFESATARFIEMKNWSRDSCRAIGNTNEVKELNEFIDVLRTKAFDIQKKLLTLGIEVTADEFSKQWHGIKEKSRMLLEVFQHHNDQVKALIGSQYSKSTHKRYETSLEHTRKFLLYYFKVADTDVKSIKYQFITEYEFWLKSVRKCNHNSTIKYLTNFKKIIHICVKNGWLDRDPFVGFKMNKRDVDRPFLTNEELDIIRNKTFVSDRLSQVRDIFLFSCYTGLAYVDTQKLSPSEVRNGVDGEKWIIIKRQKTDTSSRVPLLPQAAEIIEKYKEHPRSKERNKALPVLSNQKMNAYIHEMIIICGINKEVTYHTARHTFATTITLNNGVPIETVGKMLGHKNLKTTQHYAKILDRKVSDDMIILRNKLESIDAN